MLSGGCPSGPMTSNRRSEERLTCQGSACASESAPSGCPIFSSARHSGSCRISEKPSLTIRSASGLLLEVMAAEPFRRLLEDFFDRDLLVLR